MRACGGPLPHGSRVRWPHGPARSPAGRPPGHQTVAAPPGRVRGGGDRLRRPVHLPRPLGRVRRRVRDQPDARGHALDDVPARHGDRQPSPGTGLRRVRRSRSPDRVDGPPGGWLAGGLPGTRHRDRHPGLRRVPCPRPPARLHRHVDGHRPALRGRVRPSPGHCLRRAGHRRRRGPARRRRPHRDRRLALGVAGLPRRVARRGGVRVAHDERPRHRRAGTAPRRDDARQGDRAGRPRFGPPRDGGARRGGRRLRAPAGRSERGASGRSSPAPPRSVPSTKASSRLSSPTLPGAGSAWTSRRAPSVPSRSPTSRARSSADPCPIASAGGRSGSSQRP